jgi:hypothetical protein
MTMATGQLVDDYLGRLESELADLPRARRAELLDEIREHIAAAQAELEPGDEAGLRTILERLGDPADIAAEARERSDVQPRQGRGLEIAALLVMLLGGAIIPVIGWLAGVALLWASNVWTTREKLIGTLVPPGGIGVALILFLVGGSVETCSSSVDVKTGRTIQHCTGGASTIEVVFYGALFAFFLLGPFVTTAFLARRMRRAA